MSRHCSSPLGSLGSGLVSTSEEPAETGNKLTTSEAHGDTSRQTRYPVEVVIAVKESQPPEVCAH